LAGIYNRVNRKCTFISSDFINVVILYTSVAIAGILGNIVGYWFGSKSGYYLYNKRILFGLRKNILQSKDSSKDMG
jgi:membrane-associated protein